MENEDNDSGGGGRLPEGADLSPSPENRRDKRDRRREERKSGKRPGKSRKSLWAIKATAITFLLAAFFSFISDLTTSSGNIIVTVILLVFLIAASILFDGIGVAVAACEIAPLTAMASKKIKGGRTAIRLVNNAEIVSNVCNDVIGDIFGILSGACTLVIVMRITAGMTSLLKGILTIVISAVVSAIIVGGKAFLKNYAIHKSKEIVMMTARVIAFFVPEDRKRKKKR